MRRLSPFFAGFALIMGATQGLAQEPLNPFDTPPAAAQTPAPPAAQQPPAAQPPVFTPPTSFTPPAGFAPPAGLNLPSIGGGAPPAAPGAPGAEAAPAGQAAAAAGDRVEGGIKQVFDFRYIRVTRWDGSRFVERQTLTTEEAQAFDNALIEQYTRLANNGSLPGFTPGGAGGTGGGTAVDPRSWATWYHYAKQLELWGEYCEAMLFKGIEIERSVEDIRFPGDGAATAGAGAQADPLAGMTGPNRLIAQNQNKSLDDQTGEFFTFGGEAGQAAPTEFGPEVMDGQAADLYNEWLETLREFEAEQQRFMVQLDERLTRRDIDRKAYDEWRAEQLRLVTERVDDWARRYDGSVAIINNQRFELYKPGEVPRSVPAGTTIVETNFRLTPYDILDEGGKLRGEER